MALDALKLAYLSERREGYIRAFFEPRAHLDLLRSSLMGQPTPKRRNGCNQIAAKIERLRVGLVTAAWLADDEKSGD